MLFRLASTVFAACAAAAPTLAQATVSTLADSGAGSFRAALQAANASSAASFTIDVSPGATAAPIVLSSHLPALTKANVTIRPVSGAGRLVLDLRGPTASSGAGLQLNGNGIQLLAPVRVLVGRGHGVIVRGHGVRIANLEAIGSRGGLGLGVLSANDLTVGGLYVDGFQLGIQLDGSQRARIADDGASFADLRNLSGPGISITNGRDHVVGSFRCTNDDLGVHATSSPGLRLGRLGNPRSQIVGCRQQGIVLLQCSGATVTNADLVGNGIGTTGGHGISVLGGSGLVASELILGANASGGLLLDGGVAGARVGPNVVTRGTMGGSEFGLMVLHATTVTVADSTFGPDHARGVWIGPGSSGNPAQVSLCRCTIQGNLLAGVSVSTSTDTLICSSTITGNQGEGIEATSATVATAARGLVVSDNVIRANASNGVLLNQADAAQIGPGNTIDDNLYGGIHAYRAPGLVVRDNPSVSRNRNGGLWLVDCAGTVVARTTLRDNRGATIWGVRCNALQLGPSVHVLGAIGNGIELEGSQACRIASSRIQACSGYAVRTAPGFNVGSNGTPNVLQSCLVANNFNIAVYHAGGPPLRCELTTIAGNLRGVNSGVNQLTLDSCIVWGNQLEDVQASASGLTMRDTFVRLPAPPPGNGNSSADPLFVAPAAGDWHLLPHSPAADRANQAIALPSGATDAFGGVRPQGPLDIGGDEVGPEPVPGGAELSLATTSMARGGSSLAFRVQYPASATGMISLLLAQPGLPGGSFQAFGATVPLAFNPGLLMAASDGLSCGTVAMIPTSGTVSGALLWGGRVAPSVQNAAISLCAVAFDLTSIREVSNVATFTVR